MNTKRHQAGFTFIELLVTTALIAILMGVIAISFRQANRNARDTKRRADLQEIRGIIENYRLENGIYPDHDAESGGFEVSSDGTFMESLGSSYTNRVYLDPVNDATHFYRYRVVDQPGCAYELSVQLETADAGQTCTACGNNNDDYYCVTN